MEETFPKLMPAASVIVFCHNSLVVGAGKLLATKRAKRKIF